jgi:hypothetical protein
MASSFRWFLDHTKLRTTVGSTPLDEWSARRRDLCMTTHNRQNINAPGGIRTPDRSRQAVVDIRLRPRGHWDRPCVSLQERITEWRTTYFSPYFHYFLSRMSKHSTQNILHSDYFLPPVRVTAC